MKTIHKLLSDSSMNKKTARQQEKADSLFADGDFQASEFIYQRILNAEPENLNALKKIGLIALWNNNTPLAREYFLKVQEHSPLIGKIWPFSIELNMYMAYALLIREDRFKEAAEYYSKASGPFEIPFLKEASLRQKQLSLFVENTPYIIEGTDSTEIEFVMLDPLPVVKASINGSRPANFVIDTGAEGIFLDKAFAKEVRANVVGETSLKKGSGAGDKGSIGYGKIDCMYIGEISVRNIPVNVIDCEPISSVVFNGSEIKGIIGTQFLMHFLSTIDYKKQKLILRKPGEVITENFHKDRSSLEKKSIPFYLVASHLMFARGSFNKQNRGLFFVDTGLAGAGFLSSRTLLEEAGVDMAWNKSFIGTGVGGTAKGLNVTINEVTLGEGVNETRKFHVLGVVLEKDISIFKGELGFNVKGLVSHYFFRDQVLTLDFANMKLIMH